MLEVNAEKLRRCDVVRAKGRIDSASVGQLKETFEAITKAGRFKIVFNMKEVSFMSSAGLRQMIETKKTCERGLTGSGLNRGDLVLTEIPQNMQDVLELSGLTPVFTAFDTETQAVGSF